jgi:hypothetical protein
VIRIAPPPYPSKLKPLKLGVSFAASSRCTTLDAASAWRIAECERGAAGVDDPHADSTSAATPINTPMPRFGPHRVDPLPTVRRLLILTDVLGSPTSARAATPLLFDLTVPPVDHSRYDAADSRGTRSPNPELERSSSAWSVARTGTAVPTQPLAKPTFTDANRKRKGGLYATFWRFRGSTTRSGSSA